MRITSRQFRTVLLIELVILTVVILVGTGFWSLMCDETLNSCMKNSEFPILRFLLISVLRPLSFSPMLILAIVGGSTFGPIWGTLLTAFGAALSSLLLYSVGHYLGKRLVRPWLATNLPNTWRLIRTQDYKLIFISRWIPVFPYDLMSLIFGMADFHARRVFVYSFFGCLPAVFLFANISSPDDSMIIGSRLFDIVLFGLMTSLPLFTYEFLARKSGTSLWTRLKRVYYEIFFEVQVNNEIIKKQNFDPDKIPVILLYGFFSSRRTLAILERLLVQRGYDVMTFNLGGWMGVFFTRGIKETAAFIDRKIQRQISRYNFKGVKLVAHSKGGLVALWWILHMGGHRYCKKVVTMGTPFRGSKLTYLALVTPLGFFWKDVWQMRPGSRFLRELHSGPVYDDVKIYNLYSDKDLVATGKNGVFEYEGHVVSIAMHQVTHFEFLYRRVVCDKIAELLSDDDETVEINETSQVERRRKNRLAE